MSAYCNIHHANNCIECAIENQTKQIVAAIGTLKPASAVPPGRDEELPNIPQPQPSRSPGRPWACVFGRHSWQREAVGITLHFGTPRERQCDILTCRHCPKAIVSYGDYPPRRLPRPIPLSNGVPPPPHTPPPPRDIKGRKVKVAYL